MFRALEGAAQPARGAGGLQYRRGELATPYAPPRDALEAELERVFRQVLGIDQVGVFDEFFDLCGDSIICGRIRDRVAEEFGHEVDLETAAAAFTIAALAEQIRAARAEPPMSTASLEV